MTPDDPYARLAQLAEHLPTELDSAYMWESLYSYDRGGNAPAPELIADITHLYAVSPEGYGSQDIALLAQLVDGRWATCVAWSDTSGFDCRGQVDWRINDTRDAAIAFGLDQESRYRLGL